MFEDVMLKHTLLLPLCSSSCTGRNGHENVVEGDQIMNQFFVLAATVIV